jgi:hypothetical protein
VPGAAPVPKQLGAVASRRRSIDFGRALKLRYITAIDRAIKIHPKGAGLQLKAHKALLKICQLSVWKACDATASTTTGAQGTYFFPFQSVLFFLSSPYYAFFLLLNSISIGVIRVRVQ